MRKTALPKREREVCLRLKELRERLGFSQEAVSRIVGIKRSRWLNYERLRSPLRCDIALRICRELIVSEEWLATGKYEAAESVTRAKGAEMGRIYFRQCVDLQSDSTALHITPGSLFSVAWSEALNARYAELVASYSHHPRIVLRDSDSDDLICRYLTVMMERYFLLLENEARRLGKKAGVVRRQYARCLHDFSEILFKRFMGFKTPEVKKDQYNFLRLLANSEEGPLGFLHGND
jgi:transcriptional regulator with XRE-family HTH domain